MPRPDMEVVEPEEPVFIILWEDDSGQQGFALSDLEIVDPVLNKRHIDKLVEACNSPTEKSNKYHKDHFEALGIVEKVGNSYVAVDKAIYEPIVKANFKQLNFNKRLEIDAWKTANVPGHVSVSGALSRATDTLDPLDKIVGRDERKTRLEFLKNKGINP